MEYNLLEFPNGIRVIHKSVTNEVAHCGYIINTGSRDEDLRNNGITHFIEHALFKGTTKRRSHHILNRIDSVGGEINAFTTKENTCIYASFTKNYFERAMELLTDILFHSNYPQKELQKEREVIIDEISSYEDSPYEQVYDDFEELIFQNHPLGMNILGTTESVKRINRKEILAFVRENYSTDQIVFSVVGNIDFKKVKKLSEKYISIITKKTKRKSRIAFTSYTPLKKSIERKVFQTHSIIGNIAYGAHNKYKNGLVLLNNILGGPAMNSRLNMRIREKYGYTYNIESSYTVFSDIGLFYIYLGTDKSYLDRCIDLINRELKVLRQNKITSTQLIKAKKQLIGQINIAEDNNCNVMLGIGKSLLLYDKVDNLTETIKKVQSIGASELQQIANEIFAPSQLSQLTFISRN